MNIRVLLVLLVCLFGTCILALCPNGCSHVGVCLPDNTCQCPAGRNGADCSGKTEPLHPKTPYQCPSCYITEVGPAELYFGPAMNFPDNPKSVVNFNGKLTGYFANVNTFVLSTGNSTHDYVLSPHNSVALDSSDDNPVVFDGCGSWLNVALAKDNLVHGFYHAEAVPGGTNCDPQHQKSIGYAYSEDGGITFIKPKNNQILSSDKPYVYNVWGGVGDHGGAYWNDYFYIWYSNAEKLTVGVARSSSGLPGTWYKYLNGEFSSPGIGGDDTPTGAAGQGATVYTPTNSLLMIGGEYRFASPNFFGSNLAASDDGIKFEYVGYPLLYTDREEFGCYGPDCKEQVWYFVPVGKTGRNYVDDNFWLYYLYSFPGVGLNARYEARHAVRLTYSTEPTPAQTRTAVTSHRNLITGERWDATHLVEGLWVAESILGYSATYSLPNISTTLIVDCYDAVNEDHFATKEGACDYQRYRPIGFFFNNAVNGSVEVFSCSQTLSNGKKDRFMSTSSTCEGEKVEGSLGYLLTGSPLSSYYTTVLNRQTSWTYSPTLTNGWNTTSFDDASWKNSTAPFGGSKYSKFASNMVSLNFPFPSVYYFRRSFIIPTGGTIKMCYLFVASDNWATVYFNGVLVDTESKSHGEAQYWNRYIKIPVDLLQIGGSNLVAVAMTSHDMTGWYFFDAEVKVYYDSV